MPPFGNVCVSSGAGRVCPWPRDWKILYEAADIRLREYLALIKCNRYPRSWYNCIAFGISSAPLLSVPILIEAWL